MLSPGSAPRADARLEVALERARDGGDLGHDDATALLGTPSTTDALMAAAAARRDRAWGRTVTFSPKVFLPLTNLCRNFCDYCSFRRSPGQKGAWTMTPDEVAACVATGREQGCTEALFCLGDTPETA